MCQHCNIYSTSDLPNIDDIAGILADNNLVIVGKGEKRKLIFKCTKCGSIIEREKGNIKKGVTFCPECYKIEFYEFLNKHNLEFIENTTNYKIKCRCKKCGFTFEKTKGHLKTGGTSCPKCDDELFFKNLSNNGFTFLSFCPPYSVEFSCNKCGHISKRKKGDFKRGTVYCSNCYDSELLNTLKENNLTIISKSNNYKIKVKCNKCGCIFEKDKSSLKKGIVNCLGCREIEIESFLNRNNLSYICELSDYKIKVKCKNCDEVFVRKLSHLKQGITKCPNCCSQRSQFELDVEKELNKRNIKFKINSFNILKEKELDFYLPDYNLAIECNGDYWHSTKFKNKDYHLHKYNLCKSRGIRLIQIPEFQWNTNKEWVISLIECYIKNGDFTKFLEGNRFNLMYLSESLFNNYIIEEPSISKSGDQIYYNCGYGILQD